MKQWKIVTGLLIGLLVLGGCKDSGSVLIRESAEAAVETGSDSEEQEASNQEQTEEKQQEELPEDREMIYVDICGAVCHPGVYQLESGSRVFQLLELAGGCREDAALERINQADLLTDGQKIRIYTWDEIAEMEEQGVEIMDDSEQTSGSDSKTVNINQATKEELMELKGIGETRAEAILAYRQEHGSFSSVEELMQVDGIKGKTYEKLKDQIRIN